ncbi:nuclear mRNA export, poly(A)+RNA binding protein [Recurvomyces mirabilis]|nr:nuclear mRNA export, poly(A)+RNA binding protein [Recurvomyces mirabilis]
MPGSHAAPRAAPRGPAATRRRAGLRADRDGDVAMGLPIKGRAGVAKSSTPTGPRKDPAARPARGGILGATAQRAILRQAAGTRDVSMKEGRISVTRGGLVGLKVSGWNKSKAADNADGGVSALIKWLEKKASSKLGSRARNVKIKKSYVEGSDLIIKVPSEDANALVRMNGYGWAGSTVSITRTDGAASDTAGPPSQAEETKAMLRGVLERRYDPDTKFLNLSSLGQDEELKNQHMFDKKSTASKFFPAMMIVFDHAFDKKEDRDAAVTSVSLANNDLEDLTAVSTLSLHLPKVQNLDLSNNKFAKLGSLNNWRRRFNHLQHLILTGNPLEQNEPSYQQEIVNWYPTLRQLNGIQVRTEEEIAKKATMPDLPFPIRSALFKDEGGIAENFIRTFFTGFDTDRANLANYYYDNDSEFSYAVNTSAPRDPNAADKAETGNWEAYLKHSRNLKKISQLPARQSRKFRGAQAVAEVFAGMPATKHPDLAAEARKWIVEAKMVPGVPDVSGASPAGVDGFLITIHGEFDELDIASGQAKKKRSFDRTFIVGPGGPATVRVVSDLLTIRSYGGTQAFEPDNFEGYNMDPQQQQVPEAAAPGLPAGLDVAQAEQMVAQLIQQTNMTLQYAKDCLEQVAWNYPMALQAFESVKGNLPPEAFGSALPA